MTFTDYTELIEGLLSQNKTTGNNHSADMIQYTKMNQSRINRWLKKGELSPELTEEIKKIDNKQKWIILSEGWCGDTPVSLAFLSKIAELNPNIEFEVLLRDENLDLMDKYLTNGGRSIPKLVVFDENDEELFNWGPRPKKIQEYYTDAKKKEIPYADISIELQKLYNKDKGLSFQKEILDLMNQD